MKRTNLDEQQEQTLLKIEHNGCWLAFWGLLAAILVQQLLFGFEVRTIAGEWLLFMVLALYLAIDCVRHGIWDRHLKADPKTNLLASLIAAAAFFVFMLVLLRMRFPGKPQGAAAGAAIAAVCVFIACMALLQGMTAVYKKRLTALEEEPEEETE